MARSVRIHDQHPPIEVVAVENSQEVVTVACHQVEESVDWLDVGIVNLPRTNLILFLVDIDIVDTTVSILPGNVAVDVLNARIEDGCSSVATVHEQVLPVG